MDNEVACDTTTMLLWTNSGAYDDAWVADMADAFVTVSNIDEEGFRFKGVWCHSSVSVYGGTMIGGDGTLVDR